MGLRPCDMHWGCRSHQTLQGYVMIYTRFTEIPFDNTAAERLKQIYAVLFFMRHGNSHTDAIHRAKASFAKVADYTTIRDKCARQFAGDIGTFVEWYRSGVMLSKLIELNRLNEHDRQIFVELLNGTNQIIAKDVNQPTAAASSQLADFATEVDTAFEIVLEEIENAIEGLNRTGAKAFESSDYDLVQCLRQTGSQMTSFRDKVYSLQKEWNSIFVIAKVRNRPKIGKARHRTKLSQGLRTREAAFRIPILQALVKMGGSATPTQVLNEIIKPMKAVLNEYDLSKLPSSGVARWENTAHWARYEMVREGLLAPDSQRGVWEITDKGRSWLASFNNSDQPSIP